MRSSGICGVYLLRAEESCSFGSEYSAYLVTVEQGDQLVGHAKLPTFQCWRYHGFNRFKLLRWISPQIDFGRLNIIMPQPQRHLPDIPRGLQHQHGTGVPQDMRGDALLVQRRTHLRGRLHMLLEDIFEPRACHWEAMGIDEELSCGGCAPHREPVPHICGGLLP